MERQGSHLGFPRMAVSDGRGKEFYEYETPPLLEGYLDRIGKEKLLTHREDGAIQRRSHPAHRGHDTCFFEPLAERQRGVLHTPVGMVNQSGCGFASPEGHLQSVDHELRAQMVCHRPAYPTLRE